MNSLKAEYIQKVVLMVSDMGWLANRKAVENVGVVDLGAAGRAGNLNKEKRVVLKSLILSALLVLIAMMAITPITTGTVYAQLDSEGFYPGLGGDFTLQSSQGEVSLSELPGDWKMIGFGYSHCPDICSMLMAKIRQVYLGVAEQVTGYDSKLGVVFVSVDSERDNGQEGLASLQSFMDRFDRRFVGVSGDEASIKQVTKNYAVYYSKPRLKEVGIDERISHTDRIYLVNREGRVKKIYSRSASTDELVTDILSLAR